MTNGRRKGHQFERDIANRLKPIFPDAKRKLEYQLDDCTGVDIANTGRIKIQCKRKKTAIPMRCIEEIQEPGVHCLISKQDLRPILVTMFFDDWLELISGVSGPESIENGAG